MNYNSIPRKDIINSMVEGANSKRNEHNTSMPSITGMVSSKKSRDETNKMIDAMVEGANNLREGMKNGK